MLSARSKYSAQLNSSSPTLHHRNFANVVSLVEESLNKVPKALVLMFWHHVLLEAFNYLLLQPI